MLVVHRTALRRRCLSADQVYWPTRPRAFHIQRPLLQQQTSKSDPRLSGSESDLIIKDDFARLRDDYAAPKYPIVLAHGLFGFDEFRPAAGLLPAVQYWSGIEEALAAKGIEVITATVPPSDRIEARAKRLAEDIEQKANGRAVNIIAYVSPNDVDEVARLTDL